MRILIVDDEPQIVRVLRTSLQSSGYEVMLARDGLEAMDRFNETMPDLIITDLSMPGMNGIELTREIRRISETPIIVLSVRDQDTMKVSALDEGADDYITKPFSIQELLARVRAQLRRVARQDAPSGKVTVGDFSVDAEAHRVTVCGTEVHLTPKEFDLLLFMARNAGRVLTHKTLLRAAWGPGGANQPEYLRVLVSQLRRKLEEASERKYIESEPWVGYRLNPDG